MDPITVLDKLVEVADLKDQITVLGLERREKEEAISSKGDERDVEVNQLAHKYADLMNPLSAKVDALTAEINEAVKAHKASK